MSMKRAHMYRVLRLKNHERRMFGSRRIIRHALDVGLCSAVRTCQTMHARILSFHQRICRHFSTSTPSGRSPFRSIHGHGCQKAHSNSWHQMQSADSAVLLTALRQRCLCFVHGRLSARNDRRRDAMRSNALTLFANTNPSPRCLFSLLFFSF